MSKDSTFDVDLELSSLNSIAFIQQELDFLTISAAPLFRLASNLCYYNYTTNGVFSDGTPDTYYLSQFRKFILEWGEKPHLKTSGYFYLLKALSWDLFLNGKKAIDVESGISKITGRNRTSYVSRLDNWGGDLVGYKNLEKWFSLKYAKEFSSEGKESFSNFFTSYEPVINKIDYWGKTSFLYVDKVPFLGNNNAAILLGSLFEPIYLDSLDFYISSLEKRTPLKERSILSYRSSFFTLKSTLTSLFEITKGLSQSFFNLEKTLKEPIIDPSLTEKECSAILGYTKYLQLVNSHLSQLSKLF